MKLLSVGEMDAAVYSYFKCQVSVRSYWGCGDTVTSNTHRPGTDTQLHWHQKNLQAQTAALPLTPASTVMCLSYIVRHREMKQEGSVNQIQYK